MLSRLPAYLLAIAAPLVATVLTALTWRWLGPTPTILFVPAIMVVSVVGGYLPGFLATLLSVCAVDFFFVPPYNAWAFNLDDGIRLSVFIIVAITTASLSASRKHAYDAQQETIAELLNVEQELRQAHEQLESALRREQDLARSDPLTGIANRRALNEHLEREIARARRHSRPLTVAYIDLDDFKRVNDRLGHDVGDCLLREVATALTRVIRAGDVLARVGGDEFAVVLPETDLEGARPVLEKLRQVISETRQDDHGPVTASIGAATLARTVRSPSELVRDTDELMYVAKHSGKDAVVHVLLSS
jgi:diguanylate cyclase (GGDEF)-like protein